MIHTSMTRDHQLPFFFSSRVFKMKSVNDGTFFAISGNTFLKNSYIRGC